MTTRMIIPIHSAKCRGPLSEISKYFCQTRTYARMTLITSRWVFSPLTDGLILRCSIESSQRKYNEGGAAYKGILASRSCGKCSCASRTTVSFSSLSQVKCFIFHYAFLSCHIFGAISSCLWSAQYPCQSKGYEILWFGYRQWRIVRFCLCGNPQ